MSRMAVIFDPGVEGWRQWRPPLPQARGTRRAGRAFGRRPYGCGGAVRIRRRGGVRVFARLRSGRFCPCTSGRWRRLRPCGRIRHSPDDGGVFADTLEKKSAAMPKPFGGRLLLRRRTEKRSAAAARRRSRARGKRPDLADTVPIIFSTITGNAS